jgi:hypothetical protein
MKWINKVFHLNSQRGDRHDGNKEVMRQAIIRTSYRSVKTAVHNDFLEGYVRMSINEV